MRLVRLVIGLLLSAGLLLLLFRSADFGEMLSSFGDANYAALIPAVLVYFVGVWLRSIRWGMLLRPVAPLPPSMLFRATIVGFTVNNLLPARLGELARAFLLRRWKGVPPAATLGTIVVERLFDGLTLCGILAFAWLWFPLNGWLRGASVAAGLAFVAGTAAATLAAFSPGLCLTLVRRLAGFAPDHLRSRAILLTASFLEGLAVLRQGRVVMLSTLLSVLAWLTEAAMYYIIMLGFGFNAGPFSALLGMVAANLGTMIPSSPGFVGTFDVPLQTVLVEPFGVDPSLATSYVLVVHAALLVPVVVLGLIFLSREGLSLADLRRASRPMSRLGVSTDRASTAL